jgi:Ca-activated chloride channel family protein
MPMRLVAGHALAFAGLLISAFAYAADKPITLDARFAQPVMKAGEKQRNYVRVTLNGCKPERKSDRTPVNVSFVIDRSGSMSGDRIAQAREAAIMAINRLDPNDVASVVIFDDKVDTLIPAQKVTDRKFFTDRIRQIGTRGSTAIYAGVQQGAGEVRKNIDPKRLNRVVLLSDGLANVGPKDPLEFAQLGRDLLKEGISVSTIGLGADYNENLMLQLAKAGDGNHAYAAAPDDLIKIFNKEFDDVLASCAQTVSIDVDLAPGARVVRAVSRDGEIKPEHAKFRLNQVYQEAEHYVLIEVEVDGKPASAERDFGRVRVAYTVPTTGKQQTLDTAIRGRFSKSAEEAKASLDQNVQEAVVEQNTRARAQMAVDLMNKGQREEAAKLFKENVEEINAYIANGGNRSANMQGLGQSYSSYASTVSSAAPAAINDYSKALRARDLSTAGAKSKY